MTEEKPCGCTINAGQYVANCGYHSTLREQFLDAKKLLDDVQYEARRVSFFGRLPISKGLLDAIDEYGMRQQYAYLNNYIHGEYRSMRDHPPVEGNRDDDTFLDLGLVIVIAVICLLIGGVAGYLLH